MPRNKKVVIKKGRAFYYESHGEVVSSGLVTHPLNKVD
jgi:hypothetical protein